MTNCTYVWRIIFLQDQRVRYNQHYTNVFGANSDHLLLLERSEQESSLHNVLEAWLERTPGLEVEGFDFWGKYQRGVQQMLETRKDSALVCLPNVVFKIKMDS